MSSPTLTAPSLLTLLSTPTPTPLSPATVSILLSSPPFIPIPNVPNFRSLSSHPSLPTGITATLAFRSGTLETLTPEGHTALRNLGIRTVFDLRSLAERDAFPGPEIEGVRTNWTPSTLDNPTPSTAAVAAAHTQAEQDRKDRKNRVFSFLEMYLTILSTHAAAFRTVLLHIAAHPDEPFLFHCTAGKDRTGMLAFILADLARSSVESMDVEYALTRVGIEGVGVREFLEGKLVGPRPEERDGGLREGGEEEAEKERRRKMRESPKMREYARIPVGVMGELRGEVERMYGGVGVEEYVRKELGLSEEQIRAVRLALRGEAVEGMEGENVAEAEE